MNKTVAGAARRIAFLLMMLSLDGCGGGAPGTGAAASAETGGETALSGAASPDLKQALSRVMPGHTGGGNSEVHDRMSIFMVSVHDLLHELGQAATPTVVASRSGNWSDATTWQGGSPPMPGAVVLVPAGMTVTVDAVLTPVFKAVIIAKGATLTFRPDINTGIVVDTIFNDRGTLQIGEAVAGKRIAAQVSASITFPDVDPMFPVSIDPRSITRGVVSDGILQMFGAHKAAYVPLAMDLPNQVTRLPLLAKPAGWAEGDKLVLASTQFDLSFAPAQNETLDVASVDANGVNLSAATKFAHVRPSVPAAALAPGVIPMNIYVANLTRNVVISSASTITARRGHVMQMSNDAQIHGVLFKDLGRTDKTRYIADPTLDMNGQILPGSNPRARYAFHLHEAGMDAAALKGPEAVIGDCVVWGSPGWGFVNHSSYARFQHDVAYDFAGAGFVTEDGDEAGEFIGNIAIGGRATGNGPGNIPGANLNAPEESMKFFREVFGNLPRITQGDMGFGGHGFWFQGPDVKVVRNVSAGNKGAGFVHWSNGKYDPAADNYTRMPADRIPANAAYNPRRFADGSAVINDLPFLEFSDNQAYGNFIGLKTRFTTGHGDVPMNETIADVTHGLQTQSGSPPVLAPSVVSNLTVWANWIGVVASYTTMSYQHVLVVAPRTEVASYVVSANGFQPAVGLSVRGPRELAFDDFRVVNYKRGTYFQQNRDKPREKFLPQGIVTFGVLRDFTTSLDPKIIIP